MQDPSSYDLNGLGAGDAEHVASERGIFTNLAPVYDRLVPILSLGQDAGWKDRLVAHLPDRPAPCCLDLGCGTGDLAARLVARYPEGFVVGIDLTPRMLVHADKLDGRARSALVVQDVSRLGVRDESVDIVTAGYVLRNSPDLERTLDHVARALRPGGVLAILDFYRPDGSFARLAQQLVLRAWGGACGLLIAGDVRICMSIPRTLLLYPCQTTMCAMVEARGLTLTALERPLPGIVSILVFEKG